MKIRTTLSILAISIVAMAQDPYLNNSAISTSDIFGTSRFVSMGGAMGALGADISTISANPAGLGMVSKNEVTFTAGTSWLEKHTVSNAQRAFANLDQIGAVVTLEGWGLFNNFNLSFNYQKKADFNHSFYGETYTAASWADQLNGLADEAYEYSSTIYDNQDNYYNTLYGLADECGLFAKPILKSPNDPNNTKQISRGSQKSFDFNLSTNINNRGFLGLTIGLDNIELRRVTDYWEQRTAQDGEYHDFGYYNEQVLTGRGVNLKLGAIVRPFESSAFRVGLVFETPTWYNMNYVDDQSLCTKYYWDEERKQYVYDNTSGKYYPHYVYDLTNSYINNLNYNIISPWKLRVQAGSTHSTNFAWGAEYEYANYSATSVSYPGNYGGDVVDEDLNFQTKMNFNPQHTLRIGAEYKPQSSVSLRLGYNYITTTTPSESKWDPFFSDFTLSYPTGLDYMNLSDTHIFTCGLGYRAKWFFADLVYKYRHQTGQYYAFNDYYSEGAAMEAIPVNLSRHTINVTLGIRF